jgi:hypothetical protein
MKSKLLKSVVVALVAGVMVSACEVSVRSPAGEVVVSDAPPAALVDPVIASPGPDFVWIGGVWVWQGGHYERPPHAGAVWVAHRYEVRNGRRVFVRGGWR